MEHKGDAISQDVIRIVWAWILTIPASAAAGYLAYRLLFSFLVKL